MSELTFTDASKIRRFVYDASPDGCVAADIIELPPVSDDVAEHEHKSSDQRIEMVEHLFEELDVFATVQSSIFLRLTGLCDSPMADMMGEVFYDCAMGSMLGALTTLMDGGLISLGQVA